MYNPKQVINMKTILIRYIRCYFVYLLFFSIGMICSYLIPNSALEPRFSKSKAQIEKEELYPVYLFDTDAGIMDNCTDSLMINSCWISDAYDNIIQAAFDNNGYPRYWNGYLLTLRPFLSLFTYHQTRYISMFIILTAFCLCFSGIQQNLNMPTAIGFAISIIACFLVFIGESLQYFSVFMILFAVSFLILYFPAFKKSENSALLLFAAGMMTNFFDMLTAPLLTLGIPLILVICILNETSFLKNMKHIFFHSVSWGLGYGLCWISKWALGSLILGENIFEDAMKTANFRINGSEEIPLDRALMFKLNIDTYFFSKGHKPAVFLIIILSILFIFAIRYHKKNWISTALPLLSIGTFPYIWYLVFANHSQLHYFYTYRIQAITLFAVFAAFGTSIVWKRKILC